MHKQTKATSISAAVKEAVWKRDLERCVLCLSPTAYPHCHFIRRSQGGLGIEENIWTGCDECHRAFDTEGVNGSRHKYIEDYLKYCYPDWDKEKLVYKKYDWEK